MVHSILLVLMGMSLGIVVGFFGSRRFRDQPGAEDIRKYMSRIVNMESIEERERLLKLRMARQGLKSTRLDGGPNAQITRMRIRPRPKKGK